MYRKGLCLEIDRDIAKFYTFSFLSIFIFENEKVMNRQEPALLELVTDPKGLNVRPFPSILLKSFITWSFSLASSVTQSEICQKVSNSACLNIDNYTVPVLPVVSIPAASASTAMMTGILESLPHFRIIWEHEQQHARISKSYHHYYAFLQ